MELQQLVLKKLSSSVAQQLVKSIGCLRESFTGTLQRCLESLEKSCHESEGSLTASDAVKQILSAAYNVDLKTTTSFSVVQSFMERLRNLVHNFQFPWSTCAERQFDSQWQLQVIVDVIDSLSASKLAKTICTQVGILLALSEKVYSLQRDGRDESLFEEQTFKTRFVTWIQGLVNHKKTCWLITYLFYTRYYFVFFIRTIVLCQSKDSTKHHWKFDSIHDFFGTTRF